MTISVIKGKSAVLKYGGLILALEQINLNEGNSFSKKLDYLANEIAEFKENYFGLESAKVLQKVDLRSLIPRLEEIVEELKQESILSDSSKEYLNSQIDKIYPIERFIDSY